MRTVVFLLPKNPYSYFGGDTRMMRLVMDIVRDSHLIKVLALSDDKYVPTERASEIQLLPKSPPRAPRLALQSIRTRRSLVHCRFDTLELRRAIDSTPGDIYIAEHSYMAESFVHSERASHLDSRLFVNSHVSEAYIWSQQRGPLSIIEPRRIRRDELRVAQAATCVACFDDDEAATFRSRGVNSRGLSLTLSPAPTRILVEDAPPRLLFMGDRRWPPNQEAYLKARSLWPRIRSIVPRAELWCVGRSADSRRIQPLDGWKDFGFVDELNPVLTNVRGLFAPIVTGGGVRVKVLEAARVGLPVIGSNAAIGGLDKLLPLKSCITDDDLIFQAIELLTDRKHAFVMSKELFEANSARWESGSVGQAIQGWLGYGDFNSA